MNYTRRQIWMTFSVLVLLFATSYSHGQDPTRRTTADVVRDNLERRMNDMRNLDTLARQQAARDRNTPPKARYYNPELTKDLRRKMELSDELALTYAGYIENENSGVVKLISMNDCDKIKKTSRQIDCYQENANVREYANAFSFREKRRSIFGKSDVAVSRGFFVGARHSVQTMIVALDGVDFHQMAVDSPEISYLLSFRPGETAKMMDAQYDELLNGLTVVNFSEGKSTGRLTYSKTVEIEQGAVYALRAIAYRSAESSPSDKDADVVVLMKVVETDDEGGATVLWRELSRGPGMVMKLAEDKSVDGK
ncbi:MAG: hypothetical protein DWQ47_16065 [Acidobacteria bacterium]|nr:MAG: hypothetical protein DWQ32_03465 [Acidobacteriota bacterium]REK02430.1 MAG: hypothetical protein DWQ38_08670 [Acidobacteriota bacterium]REK13769.1 MAG: hypothetical protein DWQ43_09155 [Acidobacteriota bacterium]REK41763.1 MAG: hypothetical protein DWQ47_16065 [Acidobacteriota bacterium]